MSVGITNAHAEHALLFDHRHDFLVRGNDCTALSCEKGEHGAAIPQTAERQFPNDGRMTKKTIFFDNPV